MIFLHFGTISADFPSTQDNASALVTDLEHLDFDDTELG